MKKILPLLLIGLILFTDCHERRDPIVTIVNIGTSNRVTLGKQLHLINQYSPRIVALDFYLVPDSLGVDSILVNALTAMKNTVQVVGLHDLYDPEDIWDSLEVSHSKFKVTNHGFANLASEDKVLMKEMPMQQNFNARRIHAFSYVIAENSFGVKGKFRNTGDEDVKLDLSGLGNNYNLVNGDDLMLGKVRKEDFAGKIVIMGYIGEEEDYFYLDEQKTKKINGAEVHAAIIDEIIDL